MGERLTRGQAAQRIGVTRQRIDKLIAEGKLEEDRATVDSDELDELAATFSVDHQIRAKGGAGQIDPALAATLNKARTKDAVTKALQREWEFKQKQGLYVLRENVVQQAYMVSKTWTQKTAGLGRRLAPLLAMETDPAKLEAIVQRELDQITTEMRDGLAQCAGPGVA